MEIYFIRNEKPRRSFRGAEAPDTIDPFKNILTLKKTIYFLFF